MIDLIWILSLTNSPPSSRLRTLLQPRVHPRGRVTGGAMTLTKRDPVRAFDGHAPAAGSLRVPEKTGLIGELMFRNVNIGSADFQ